MTKQEVVIQKLIEANADLEKINGEYFEAQITLKEAQKAFDQCSHDRLIQITKIGIWIDQLKEK